jgi:hypothetical protein
VHAAVAEHLFPARVPAVRGEVLAGQVDDRLGRSAGVQHIQAADGGDATLEVCVRALCVAAEHGNGMAFGQQPFAQRRADEAGTAGDEDIHVTARHGPYSRKIAEREPCDGPGRQKLAAGG